MEAVLRNSPEYKKQKVLNRYYAKRNKKLDRIIFVAAFLIIPIINFLIWYVYANFSSFLMAFQRVEYGSDAYGSNVYWTFENFERIVDLFKPTVAGNAGDLLIALRNTIYFDICGICLGLPLSIFICYFIYKKIAGYKAFRFIIYLPTIICATALVSLYKTALNPGGPWNVITGSDPRYITPINNPDTAIFYILFYCLVFNLGGNIIVIGGAMNSLNKEVLEAGQLDGCNWFQELIHIILPAIWPTVSTIIILAAAGFLGASGPILAFTQGRFNTNTLSFYIYKLISNADGAGVDIYLASAIGLCMTLVSFPLALIVKRITNGKDA